MRGKAIEDNLWIVEEEIDSNKLEEEKESLRKETITKIIKFIMLIKGLILEIMNKELYLRIII